MFRINCSSQSSSAGSRSVTFIALSATRSLKTCQFAHRLFEQAKLCKKRTVGLRKLGSLGLLMVLVSLVAIGIGAASIGIQASDPTPPYMLGLALIAGVMMLGTGGVAVLTAKQGRHEEGDKASSSLKCYVVGFFILCLIAMVFCLLIALGGGVVGVVLCVLEGASDKLKDICQPHHDANLALSVLTLLVCLALFVLGTMGTCFLCFYGNTLGFKSRRERRMEFQMQRMMQANVAKQQQFNTAYSHQ